LSYVGFSCVGFMCFIVLHMILIYTRSSAVTERPRVLRVIEYLAKSLMVIQGHLKLYALSLLLTTSVVVPFLGY